MDLDRIGKYRVVGRIGQGAMGEVYKAHDPLLNRNVALKTIHPSLAANPEFRERFRREAQSVARLNHPNIVTVFDFGEESGVVFMAMELLEGTDLREALRRGSLGPLDARLRLMQELCEGLAFAHAQGVVHRDLKPGNIHLLPSGHVKILDFGLARLGASEMTRAGTVMGTPLYMSPEQVRGERVDARADVFSLGALFYEILSGQRAFDAEDHAQVLRNITEKEPEPLLLRAPELPTSLALMVEKALAKAPERRYRDAGGLGEALSRERDALASTTLTRPGDPDDGERTVVTGAGETLLMGPGASSVRSVAGANALDLARASGEGRRHEATVRPDLTVGSGPDTEVAPRSRGLWLGAVVLAVTAFAGAGYWYWARTRPAPAAPQGPAADETVGILTETLLISKVELARADLDNRDYAAAAAHAREALAIDASYADARAILERAQTAQRDLVAAAAEATTAFGRGDAERASTALARVLALDPRHPVADRLSARLNRFFQDQAGQAREQARAARAAAEAGRASGESDFRRAAALYATADDLSERAQHAVAAQKYLESRNGFELALSSKQARAVASVPRPSPSFPARLVPSAAPSVPPAPPRAAASTPQQSLSVAAVAPSATTAAAPRAASPRVQDTRLEEIGRTLAGYERAYETLDVSALRSVMDLGADQEKKLREAFEAFKSYEIQMSGANVELEGDARARVSVSRQDTVNGRAQPPMKQTFVLSRQGASWRIVSYSFER